MKKISIGICCYNEELNIEPMYRAVTAQMASLPEYDYEIIFEDNASTDTSEQILESICAADAHVIAILHSMNYGVELSSYACMKHATGDTFISIPCDFEEPPELIPEFVHAWEEGHQVVLGQKIASDERKVDYLLRGLYYRIIGLFSDVEQLQQVTGFGLYDRSAVDIILAIKRSDPYMYTRHMVVQYGLDYMLLPYRHGTRLHGTSSYSKWSYLSLAINSLCNTSTKPLRLVTLLGLFGFLVCLVAGIVLCIIRGIASSGFVWLACCAFLQILCTGILGEYLTSVLRKVSARPVVVVRRRIQGTSDEGEPCYE